MLSPTLTKGCPFCREVAQGQLTRALAALDTPRAPRTGQWLGRRRLQESSQS